MEKTSLSPNEKELLSLISQSIDPAAAFILAVEAIQRALAMA